MSVVSMLLASAAAIAAPETEAEPQRSDDIVVTGQRSEGSDDYGVTTQRTATRIEMSQRETPQSISVVTRAQIDDFQLNDVNALLNTVPGVSVLTSDTDRIYYSARGFDIQTFQLDGVGLPFAFGIQTGSIDTAIYDRIEVVRGAPGLLSPTGNPSAVVNFVRKRPFRELKASGSAQYGSFDNVRLDADVSVPLTANGAIRARAVGAFLDTDSHLDRYGLRRWTGYGIVEADLGPNTVLSGGYGHQDHRSRAAMWGAIPLYYTDGTRLEFDRTANYAPDWASWGVVERQIFGDLTHDFGNGWTAKLSVLRRANSEANQLFYVYGNPVRGAPGGIDFGDPNDPADTKAIFSYPGAFRGQTRNLTIDAYLSGKVSAGGRDHDVVVGLQRGAERYRQYSSYDYSQIAIPLSLDTFFQGIFPRVNFPEPYDLSLDTHSVRETIYGLVRLNPADQLKIMLGGNYTHATSEGVSYQTPQVYDRSRFSPFVGATFDLSSNLSLYASYAKIFRPQVEVSATNEILPPIVGDNIEGGIKGEWFGGRLYASAALFQARQNNTAFGQFDPALGRTVFVPVDAKSQGIELEFGGELAPGLQATGGFTAMKIRNDDDQPERTFVPRNLGRLNLTYSPPALPRVKVGTSIQYQSDFYFEPRGLTPAGDRIRLSQGDYVLADVMGRYELTDNLAVSVNVRNVTNHRYLSALTFDQSFYGAPRTVLGTVSFRY